MTGSTDAAPNGRSAGGVVDDSVITTKVKAALMSDSSIKSSDISVETRKGEVMLSGFVGTNDQVDRALKVASGVDGVSRVNNKLAVRK